MRTIATWAAALILIALFVLIVANGGTHGGGLFVPSVILDPSQVRFAS